jgi:hypothetical protein
VRLDFSLMRLDTESKKREWVQPSTVGVDVTQ